MRLFLNRRDKKQLDRVEARFQTVVSLVKDLDTKEFNRLKEGMELCWKGYQKVGQAKTPMEKEMEDIEGPEKFLEEEIKNGRDS